MELRHLEHFLTLAEWRHFTRAAAASHLTQSSLSSSIRSLERDLGTDLFVRSPRSVELTAAGRALLQPARRALEAAEAGRNAVAAVRGVVQGELRIGAVQVLGGVVELGAVISAYHQRYPGVQIEIHNAGVPVLIRQLLDGDFDLAFVDRPLGPDESKLDVRELGSDPLVLAVSATSPLAERAKINSNDKITLSSLVDADFVEYRADSALRAHIDDVFAELGLRRRSPIVSDTILGMLELVAHDAGVALVPSGAMTSFSPDRVLALATDPAITRELLLVMPADRTPAPAAAALLEVMTALGLC